MVNNLVKLLLLLIINFLASSLAFSLNSDREHPLKMVAGSANLDNTLKIGTYKGNVQANQGSTQLNGNTVITQLTQQNQLQELTALGSPAIYRTLPDDNKDAFVAKANTIKYFPLENQVLLLGNAIATQGKNSYQGPIIQYNTVQQSVISPLNQHGRTTIIIQPKNKTLIDR